MHYNRQMTKKMMNLKFTIVFIFCTRLAFLLIPKVKNIEKLKILKSQYFSSNINIQAAVHNWIKNKSNSFFMDGMQKIIFEKCIRYDYVKKK